MKAKKAAEILKNSNKFEYGCEGITRGTAHGWFSRLELTETKSGDWMVVITLSSDCHREKDLEVLTSAFETVKAEAGSATRASKIKTRHVGTGTSASVVRSVRIGIIVDEPTREEIEETFAAYDRILQGGAKLNELTPSEKVREAHGWLGWRSK